MAYTIEKNLVVDYPPSKLRDFHVYGFEWIDDLHFVRPPGEFLAPEQVHNYTDIARERFLQAGWEGDGEVGLLWLPPFVFPLGLRIPPVGIVVWHVKQKEDGVSFLLSPIELPFEEFQTR